MFVIGKEPDQCVKSVYKAWSYLDGVLRSFIRTHRATELSYTNKLRPFRDSLKNEFCKCLEFEIIATSKSITCITAEQWGSIDDAIAR